MPLYIAPIGDRVTRILSSVSNRERMTSGPLPTKGCTSMVWRMIQEDL